jgi:protein NirF
VFASDTLELLADIPAEYEPGKRAKVVGLEDTSDGRFAFSLFEAGEIWLADLSEPHTPRITRYRDVGRQPYDALVTPDGRWYIAGLFGEDGLALLDLWNPERGVRRILDGYGRGQEALPVYKMPHLEGWAMAGRHAYLPAIGRHEVLVVDTDTWREVARIQVAGQPVFVMARPDGRQVWVNFALPHNDLVQVIDTQTHAIARTLRPGKAVLHLEFTPRGEAVWISARDDDRVVVYDTSSFEQRATLAAEKPSGIFLTARAFRTGL